MTPEESATVEAILRRRWNTWAAPLGIPEYDASLADEEAQSILAEFFAFLIGGPINERRVRVLRKVLHEARERLSRVDNGYCSLCGRHRPHHDNPSKGGTLPALPSLCENTDCFSHVMDAALANGSPHA